MTEAELAAIDGQVAAGWRFQPGPVPDLVAEVRRLRHLVLEAEWAGSYEAQGDVCPACPWCGGEPKAYGSQPAGHEPACPAFPPKG
jgi:hypothetical protein